LLEAYNNIHNNESLVILTIKICLFEHECTNNNKTYNILPLLNSNSITNKKNLPFSHVLTHKQIYVYFKANYALQNCSTKVLN